ncbi:MAG: DUF2997 domain-containing protein [Syntrophales bacterium]|nr:DUF2997 domain-containing protein [Syntrophales bacterium]MDD5642188.1 DUF2997 domain-containing protein [Syntrophales bacterium]
MQEIVIDFDVTGEVKMEGKGFQDKSCDQAMGYFEKALGVVSNRRNKPEYFQGVRSNASQRA